MNTIRLPNSYVPVKKVDLQKNIKLAVLVNIGAIVLAILVIVLGSVFVPVFYLFSSLFWNGLIMLFGSLLYMVLHELTHGFFMKRFSGVKPKYGFTGLYAYAKCNAFFDKKSYFIITLSPIILLGVVLAAICFFVPTQLFWGVYLIQAINISGAAGDIYVSFLLCRMPKELLVYDFGASMFFYLPKEYAAK